LAEFALAQKRSFKANASILGVRSRRKSRNRAQKAHSAKAEDARQKSGTERAIHAKGGKVMAMPFDQRPDLIWFDGKLIPTADCKISVLTHGLHYASTVFEGERAYGGVIFKGTEHSERLKRSAQLMDFEIPFSVAEIDAAKRLVLERNNQAEAYVRAIAWRGSDQLGVSAQNNKIHLAVATWEWPSYFDPAQRLKGIRLDLAEYRRPDPRTAPALAKAAGLYAICTISKHRAERRGFADAMMLDWLGRVAECTGANIFFIKDGKIHTPIADCFLAGITRATAIMLARRHGIEVIERRIMPEELADFSECFITGTAAEVTAVSQIADWNFTPGRVTQQLMADYTAEVRPKGKAAAA
jgi:branched-chain amino acid aminotransferase